MFTIIQQIVQGLVSGIFAPLMTYLGKKQDDTLAGFQSGAAVDAATYATYVQGYVQISSLKAAQNRNPFVAAIGGGAGLLSLLYFGAITFDSVFHFGWNIAAMPSGWDDEAKIVLGSFLLLSPQSPVSAVTAWLHRK